MSSRIYNVKQAAKILGLSTNTTYKYLNEGRIKAARGHIRGTFIITAKALEDFLGSKIPETALEDPSLSAQIKTSSDAEAIIEVTPPTLATKILRYLLIFCLVLIIIDLLFSPSFSPLTTILKLLLIFLFVFVSYQFGGFVKK